MERKIRFDNLPFLLQILPRPLYEKSGFLLRLTFPPPFTIIFVLIFCNFVTKD